LRSSWTARCCSRVADVLLMCCQCHTQTQTHKHTHGNPSLRKPHAHTLHTLQRALRERARARARERARESASERARARASEGTILIIIIIVVLIIRNDTCKSGGSPCGNAKLLGGVCLCVCVSVSVSVSAYSTSHSQPRRLDHYWMWRILRILRVCACSTTSSRFRV